MDVPPFIVEQLRRPRVLAVVTMLVGLGGAALLLHDDDDDQLINGGRGRRVAAQSLLVVTVGFSVGLYAGLRLPTPAEAVQIALDVLAGVFP